MTFTTETTDHASGRLHEYGLMATGIGKTIKAYNEIDYILRP